MVNPYQALTTYEGADWKVFLEEIGLLDVFGNLLGNFNAPDSARKIIRYIVWTYSVKSERHVAGMDWENNKRGNFDFVGLPGDLWEEIGLLKDPEVLRSIHRWLDWQEEPLFKHLQCLRDLNNEIDYDQKFKNANYSVELDKMIAQLENQSIQNNPALKDAMKETQFKKRSVTMGPESFSI